MWYNVYFNTQTISLTQTLQTQLNSKHPTFQIKLQLYPKYHPHLFIQLGLQSTFISQYKLIFLQKITHIWKPKTEKHSPKYGNIIYLHEPIGKHYLISSKPYGVSLEYLFMKCNEKFSLKTVLLLANELLTLIQSIHEHDILLHRSLSMYKFIIAKPNKFTKVIELTKNESESSDITYLDAFKLRGYCIYFK